jgi:hypothetical protein
MFGPDTWKSIGFLFLHMNDHKDPNDYEGGDAGRRKATDWEGK